MPVTRGLERCFDRYSIFIIFQHLISLHSSIISSDETQYFGNFFEYLYFLSWSPGWNRIFENLHEDVRIGSFTNKDIK